MRIWYVHSTSQTSQIDVFGTYLGRHCVIWIASVHSDEPHQNNDIQQQPDVFGTDEYQVAPQDSHNIPQLQQNEYVSSDTDEDMFPGDNVNLPICQFADDSTASGTYWLHEAGHSTGFPYFGVV